MRQLNQQTLACSFAVVAALGVGCHSSARTTLDQPLAPQLIPTLLPPLHRCGWIVAGDAAGASTFVANASSFTTIHPDWFALAADHITLTTLTGADDASVVGAARAHNVLVMPLITGDAQLVRSLLADATAQATHVANLVALARSHNYDGIDLAYEHLDAAADRAPFTAFASSLAQALHAANKQLDLTLTATDHDTGADGYDYAALAAVADAIHLLGHNFHQVGTHAGPLAPLGWIDAVAAHAASTGAPSKFVLTLANFGATPTTACANATACAQACTGAAISPSTDHMIHCPFGDWEAGRSPNCSTANGTLFFEDLQSLEEKTQSAQANGLAGVGYWALGGEPAGLFAMLDEYFPLGVATMGPAPAPPPTPTPAPRNHARCGWIGPNDPTGNATFIANATWYDAVHPSWYAINSDHVTVRKIAGAEDPQVIAAARASQVKLIPLVAGIDDVNQVRGMFNDPTNLAAHVQVLVDLATQQNWDGLDVDYEHLWSAADRPGYQAFLTQLVAAMHAVGKEVSIAVPAIESPNPNNAWDYDWLAQNLDELHIMGYDFHSLGTHSGPLAPLGWIDAVCAHAASTSAPSKWKLGLGNYGVTPSWQCDGDGCAAACNNSYATTTTHMATCSFGTWDSGRAPNCSTANGQVFFEDLASMEEKVQKAQLHGLGGITYWVIGREYSGFFGMVAKYY
jgi:spore germination protein YaaH